MENDCKIEHHRIAHEKEKEVICKETIKTFINKSSFFATMEAKILEEKKQHLVVELKGASHGLCNALEKELWNDDGVKAASYTTGHPLIGVPKLTIETATGTQAKQILTKAIARLKKRAEKFKSELKNIK